jgi:hypothetical protein
VGSPDIGSNPNPGGMYNLNNANASVGGYNNSNLNPGYNQGYSDTANPNGNVLGNEGVQNAGNLTNPGGGDFGYPAANINNPANSTINSTNAVSTVAMQNTMQNTAQMPQTGFQQSDTGLVVNQNNVSAPPNLNGGSMNHSSPQVPSGSDVEGRGGRGDGNLGGEFSSGTNNLSGANNLSGNSNYSGGGNLSAGGGDVNNVSSNIYDNNVNNNMNPAAPVLQKQPLTQEASQDSAALQKFNIFSPDES